MILQQHIALYAMAVMDKEDYDSRRYEPRLLTGVPWLLLPDALELWGCPKQLTHFWENPTGTDTAWMEFPMGVTLSEMTPENLLSSLKKHFDESKYADCVLGSVMDITKFDEHNYSHSNFRELRIHLINDAIQDEVLCKEVVNVNGRYDGQYAMKSQKLILDEMRLKHELQLFNGYGFLYLVGQAYRKTHVLFNQKWMKEHACDCLGGSYYPSDLANVLCKRLQIPDWLEDRINRGDFVPNCTEFCENGILGITETDELVSVFDRIFSWAYVQTMQNL